MITIEKANDHAEYADGHLLVVAKHGLKDKDVFKIIEMAAELGMRDEILRRLGAKQESSGKKYMVSCDNGKAPYRIHQTSQWKDGRVSAVEEARRLASSTPGTFRVLRLEKTIVSQPATVRVANIEEHDE